MALIKWSDNIAAAALQGNYDGYIQSSLLQLRLTGAIGSNPANGTAVYSITENTTYKVRLYMDTRFRVAACASIAMNTVMTNYYRDAADKSDTTVAGAYKEAEITSEAGQVYMPVVYWASGGSKTWSEVYDTIEVRQQLTGTLELTTPPTKTQYNVGEELDLTGMVVTAAWSDGTKEAVTDYTVSGYDSSAAGTCSVTVTYQGETVSFEVTVAAASHILREYIGSPNLEDVVAVLNTDTGLLTLSGTGTTKEFSPGATCMQGNKDSVTSIVIEDGITGLGKCIFSEYNELVSISLPDTLTGTIVNTFAACEKLPEVEIKGTALTVQTTFPDCSSLRRAVIYEGVETIGSNCFANCVSLEEVMLPEKGIKTIGTYAFGGCTAIREIYIKCADEIEGSVLYESGVQKLRLGAGVKKLLTAAFNGNTELTELIIDEGLESIGLAAFNGCTGLSNVVVPESVTEVLQASFERCQSLKDITFKGRETAIFDSDGVLPESTAIHGYIGSTAQSYANKYSRTFVPLDAPQSIRIATLPDKTQYNTGDALDLTGMAVEAVYDTGYTQAVTDFTVSGFDSTSTGTCIVTITYQELTATFEVTVKATVVEPGVPFESLLNTIEGMEAIRDNTPNYNDTDEIQGADWTKYGGKTIGSVSVMYNMVSKFNSPDGKSIATLFMSYSSGKNLIYYIYRQEGTLDTGLKFLKIRVQGYSDYDTPTDDHLVIYELFMFEDGYLYINVLHTDTSYAGLSRLDSTRLDIPAGITQDNQLRITVKSAGNADQEITYETYQPSGMIGIEITSLPEKLNYYGNEFFDSAGLVVSIVGRDGSREETTEYGLTGFDSSTPGVKDITVTIDGFTASFEITVSEIAIIGIEVTSPPAKTEYLLLDELDTTGMLISYQLSDGTKEPAVGYKISSIDPAAPGEKTVVVEYGRFTADFIVTILRYVTVEIGFPIRRDVISTLDGITGKVTITGIGKIGNYGNKLEKWKDLVLSASINPGVTSIGVNSFNGCRNLDSVDIPSSVVVIEAGAFGDCESLPEVILPENIVEIQGTTFYGCKRLRDISIPGEVVFIGDHAFYGCESLTQIEIPGNVASIERGAFSGCSKLTEIVIPPKISDLAEKIFSECIGLEKITISGDVNCIGESAFHGCKKLQEVIFKGGIKEIGTSAFYGCESLSFPMIPYGVTSIGPGAFMGCNNLVTVTIPQTVTFISPNNTFSSCEKLETIIVNKSKDSIPGAPWDAENANIIWREMEELLIAHLPDKLIYAVGEELELSGLAVEISYSNGTTEAATGYAVSGFDSTVAGEKTITVTYQGYTATFVVTVYGAVTGIRIAQYPNKIYYKLNEPLDATGLQVLVITDGGLERIITDYTLSELDSSTVGNKQITVTYEVPVSADTTAVYMTHFYAKVTTTGDNPFESGELIKVIVHWPNGEFADLTNTDLAGGTGVMELRESICSDNYFIFGGCISNMLKFTTHSNQFLSTEESAYPHGDIEVSVECKGTQVKIFTGAIDSGKRKAGLTQREIIAYDKLYQYRNTDIAWWYKNKTTDKQMVLTQKQFRDELFGYLGIEQVPTKLYYDDAYVPNTNISGELNAVRIIKDMCLQNNVFGWCNRDGKFEYLKLPENSRRKSHDNAGNVTYEYFPATVYVDNYEACDFTEGRVWYPTEFYSDPTPQYGFSSGPPNAQEAYERNVYHNRNSFFVGNYDWLDTAWLVNEYGVATVQDPVFPICFGPFADIFRLYRAQGYNVTVRGNPLNKVGDTIEITVRKTADDGTQLEWVIHSYIMSRTLKILGDTSIYDTYSARNAPYNGNNTQAGTYIPELSAGLFQARAEGPVISYADFDDGTTAEGELKKARLKCVKSLTEAEYTALQASSEGLRTDTLYFIKEE